MTRRAFNAGFVQEKRMELVKIKIQDIENVTSEIIYQSIKALKSIILNPIDWHKYNINVSLNSTKRSAWDILNMPKITIKELQRIFPKLNSIPEYVISEVETLSKYEYYLQQQEREIKSMERFKSLRIPHDIDYNNMNVLSREEVEILNKNKPLTIIDAAKLPGIRSVSLSRILAVIKSGR